MYQVKGFFIQCVRTQSLELKVSIRKLLNPAVQADSLSL